MTFCHSVLISGSWAWVLVPVTPARGTEPGGPSSQSQPELDSKKGSRGESKKGGRRESEKRKDFYSLGKMGRKRARWQVDNSYQNNQSIIVIEYSFFCNIYFYFMYMGVSSVCICLICV